MTCRGGIRAIVGWTLLALTLVALTLGFALLGWWAHRANEQDASRRDWPTTQARLISSDIIYYPDSPLGRDYTIRIVYEYNVGGLTFTGRGAFQSFTRRDAEKAITGYEQGPFAVYYNPQQPGTSRLHRDVPSLPWVILLFALIFAGYVMVASAATSFIKWAFQLEVISNDDYDEDDY